MMATQVMDSKQGSLPKLQIPTHPPMAFHWLDWAFKGETWIHLSTLNILVKSVEAGNMFKWLGSQQAPGGFGVFSRVSRDPIFLSIFIFGVAKKSSSLGHKIAEVFWDQKSASLPGAKCRSLLRAITESDL